MPSLCQNIKTRYEHLQRLTAEFTVRYSAAKDSGDLQEVRRLQKELEAARDTLIDHIIIVTVPDAKNPHHEALIEAGLDPAKTQEQQEITVDIRKEIERQLAVYKETKDDSGNPCLEEWVKDIAENQGLIYAEVAKDRAKITERIKAGMIPVVMPGRDVQIRTWEAALLHLKPILVKDGAKKARNEKNHLNDCYKSDSTKKMTVDGFFKNIPDQPYLVWVKPTQKPDPDTLKKSFANQQTFYATLVREHPDLYDPTDLIPTEYIALQAMFTSSIQERFKELQGGTEEPSNIKPLDNSTFTHFLSAGEFSYKPEGTVPFACFAGWNSLLLGCFLGVSAPSNRGGFRPASRT